MAREGGDWAQEDDLDGASWSAVEQQLDAELPFGDSDDENEEEEKYYFILSRPAPGGDIFQVDLLVAAHWHACTTLRHAEHRMSRTTPGTRLFDSCVLAEPDENVKLREPLSCWAEEYSLQTAQACNIEHQ